jgi:protein involved in polysaccharide export with SLBB domain
MTGNDRVINAFTRGNPCRRLRLLARTAFLLLSINLIAGCAALSNPVADGIPVDRVPPELLVESKKNFVKVPLGALQQQQDEIYRLAAGDILGIWIGEGILGDKNNPPQSRFFENSDLPPALGTPIPVRENGTISLPQLKPIDVRGLTLPELEQKLRTLYTEERKIFKPGQESVIVTLVRKRTYTIYVLREDGGATLSTGGGAGYGLLGQQTTTQVGGGSGRVIQLAPGENNILTALTRTGGLPGLGAEDEVIIERGGLRRQTLGGDEAENKSAGPRFIRIPLRLHKGASIPFAPNDVVLYDGDSVYVRARKGEYFYTGGLLPSQKGVLPRDEDLDVVQAITQVGGVLVTGLVTGSNLSGNVGASGIGQPNPSLVSVLRRTPEGGQINIRVNLNQALRDPAERILLCSGDIVIMQMTPAQAVVQYLSGQVQFNFASKLLTTPSTTINTTAHGP